MPASRRRFIAQAAAGLAGAGLVKSGIARAEKPSGMRFGLVTYLWGADWDVPTLIHHCTEARVHVVELRVDHAHGVSPALSQAARAGVKARFADSPVAVVGLGTNFHFHSPDEAARRQNVEGAKEYVRLSRDIGGSGVKVKPDALPKEATKELTLERIARSLAELGRFAADFGQEIRLEVHGGVCDLGDIRTIMVQADQPNVLVCWNSNRQDLEGAGIEANFALVREHLSDVVHVHELDQPAYPYATLARLLVAAGYNGCVCLEASSKPEDRPKALAEQRGLWEKLVQAAGAA